MRRVPIASALLVLAACAPPAPLELSGSAMGTTWTVTLAPPVDAPGLENAAAVVRDILTETDATLSTWNANSEISALNRHKGRDWIPLSAPLYDVLAAARAVSGRTEGAFDVTVGPLTEVWGIGGAPPRDWPSSDEVRMALGRVGYDKLELRDHPRAARKLVEGILLDVSGIAPGYAVDRISEGLARLGYGDHIVELGGEVRCRGRGPGGRSWRIAIEQPIAGNRAVHAIVAVDDRGISTSGDYRDYRVVAGHRIGHTIDPRSGLPVSHGLASVSVVHESVMLADAYATALMVLGPETGYALAERLGLPALFIERRDGKLVDRATPSFAVLRVRDATLPSSAHN